MEIRCLKDDGGFTWSNGFGYNDVFLVRQTDKHYFLYLKENGKQVSLTDEMDTIWCFYENETYIPTARVIAKYKKLLKGENQMTKAERIEELKAEIARLEKEDEFRPYLAWVSDSNEMPDNKCRMALLTSKEETGYYLFSDNVGTRWRYATPLTRKEILSYLPPVKTKYDWDAILEMYPNAKVVAMHPDGEIVVGSHSKIAVGCEGFHSISRDGVFLFIGSMPEWVLDKDCDWRDSIEYRRGVQ